MKYNVALILFLLTGSIELNAIDNQTPGARPKALAGAYVSMDDVWSSFYNQAGLSSLKSIYAGVFYESRFQLKELSLMAGTVVLPFNSINFGLNYSQFGKGTFKESKIGLAVSKNLFEKLSIGIQFDYFLVTLPENPRTKGFPTFEGGLIYRYSKELQLGIHLFNPIKQGFETANTIHPTPVTLKIGGCQTISENLLICFELEKTALKNLIYKAGLEFMPARNLAIRFGTYGKPFSYTTGIGYFFNKIVTDIGFDYHGNLGITPTISVQFEL